MKYLPLFLMALALLAITVASLFLGKYQLPATDLLQFAGWKLFGLSDLSSEKKALLENIIIHIRLPRILAAIMIGASLSVAGAAYQALFINPLVSPGLLGVLAGASFGAAFGLLFAKSWAMVQLSTVVFAFVAVGVTISIARIYKMTSIIMLVLGGVISGALFTSLLSIVKYAADPSNQLPAIVYWLMGSLSSVSLNTVALTAIPAAVGVIVLILHGRQLNAMSMGDEEAMSLGINVRRVRYVVIFFATLISALTVMVGGMIGWVGLIIPHICRMIVGPNNQILLPAAAFVGAAYLVLADDLSRMIFLFEIPIGIITSLIGIPFFILVLKNAHRGWR